jgi:chloramphenicol 3-O phosphotransferase
MVPTAIILHGTTSAGKSSLAKALQATSSTPVFHISMDAFVEMSRRRDMRSEAEIDQAFRLHCRNFQSTLRHVADSHFDIVLDLVLRDEAEFATCLQVLASRPTFVIGVWSPLDVLEERERIRGDRGFGMARSQFGHSAYDREYAMKLDTSTVIPEEGARIIREYVQKQISLNSMIE